MSKIIPLNEVYITDRTRIVTRKADCARRRYLNFDYAIDGEPKGIQRRAMSLPLLTGEELHEAHAKVLAFYAGLPQGKDIDAAVADIISRYSAKVAARGVFNEENLQQLIREQTALLEAMLRAFVYTWVPRILEDFDIIGIETPMDWVLAPGLVQKLRFDVTARRKGDGQLVILDYKSMPYVSDVWSKKLETSTQTSLYTEAAEELYEEPAEIAYLGTVKGTYRTDTAKGSPFYQQKIQTTPYLYAYALKGDVGAVYEPNYTSKKGFVKVRTYEEMSVKKWMDFLWNSHRQLVNDNFVWNPPFAPTKTQRKMDRALHVKEELEYVAKIRQFEAMRAQALRDGNEALYAKAMEYLDLEAAPMNKENCYKYGADSQCPFVQDGPCFNEGSFELLLEDGAFEVREPHHGTELEEAA